MKKTKTVQSVDRALTIIELLGNSSEPLGVTEIGSRLDLHKSTAFGLLCSLENKGFVRQITETGKYILGLRFVEFGEKITSGLDLRVQARPFLKKLVNEFQETVHLVVKDNLDCVYIDKVLGPRSIVVYSQIGKRAPVYSTSVGKCLLAYFTEKEQEKALANSTFECFTPNTITDIGVIKEHLVKIREQGFSIDDEEIEIGLRCVAAPVFNHKGNVVAAVSIAGPGIRITDERMPEFITAVKECAFGISETLGQLT